MTKQTCNKCDIEKDLSDFYIRKETGNHRKDCKDCQSENKKKHREKNIVENNKKLENVDKTQKKTCSICNIEKELNEFSICKGTKSGFYSWCLVCSKIRYKKQNKTTKKYTNIDTKICNTCNKTKLVLENFREKHSIDGYSNICKDCEKVYRKNNSKIIYQKKKQRLNTDLQFKLSESIRARVRVILGDNKVIKPKTENLIGCTLERFIQHLQTGFYDNISLENHGNIWHLDHIIPCNWFDLTDIKQIKALCHYTNLQPLLIKDNSIKSNRLDWIHPKKGYQLTFLRLVHSGYLQI